MSLNFGARDSKELAVARQEKIDADERQALENNAVAMRAAHSDAGPTVTLSAGLSQIFGIRDERFIRQRANPFVFYKHMPVALLTDQAESYDNLAIQWSFSNGQFNARRGVVSSKDLVKNIIGMRISGGRFPWQLMTFNPFQRQIFIQVAEFADVAFRNRWISYHFIMVPEIEPFDPGPHYDRPYSRFTTSFDGYFWFPAPVQDLNTLTLKFAVSNMYFDARRVATKNQIWPTYPQYIMSPMRLPYPHNGTTLVDGATYYFTDAGGFPYTAPLDLVTRQEGWPITDVGGGYFSIPVDGSTVLSFTSVDVWVTPVAPIDFSIKLDLIYLGDQDTIGT